MSVYKWPEIGTQWSEDDIQMWVIREARRAGYLVHGDQNAAKRSDGGRRKLLGMLSGWPDLTFILDYRIVYIELKTKKGKLSPAQEELHLAMRERGCEVEVVYGLDGPSVWNKIEAVLS